jgi:hypothetical protein
MTQMLDSMLSELREEAATTKRVLERIPSDKLAWRPSSQVNIAGTVGPSYSEHSRYISEDHSTR